MATTCKLIAKTTLGSSASSIDFTSIPGTYTDLLLLCMARSASSVAVLDLRFNSDTGSNYSWRQLRGNGAAASSSSGSSQTVMYVGLVNGSTYTADTFASSAIYIPNYASTSVNKSVSGEGVTETNATTSYIDAYAGLWSSTAAITAISIFPDGNNFASGSSAYLYGITKA